MKLFCILTLLSCISFVLSVRNFKHKDSQREHLHYPHSHRYGEKHLHGVDRDKYNYFYKGFGEKEERRAHKHLYGNKHGGHGEKKEYCKPGEPCWPTDEDLSAIYEALDPSIHRSLVYHGLGTPVPCAIPISSPDDQPLYGAGYSLAPAALNDHPGEVCFVTGLTSTFCLLTVRSNPLEGWTPAMVAWPTTALQAQLLTKFASLHNLCISITNTGHDYLNRHSCDHSANVRTSLLKEIAWDESPYTVRVGAGVTAAELQYQASLVGKSVTSGWAPSVGIVGWAIGGGHGPLSPKLGLGADQIVGVELVGPDGCLYKVDAMGTVKTHLDGRQETSEDCELLWAVRGGGGSTWGLITSLTLKTHPLPRGGYIGFQIGAVGDFCTGQKDFLTIIEAYLAWTLPLSSKWGGYAIFTPYPTTGRPCELEWAIEIAYVYQGGDDSAVDTWQALVSSIPKAVESASGYAHYEHLWDMIKDEKVEAIIPVPYLAPSDSYAGAIPSVLLSRETVESGALLGLIEKQVAKCTPVHCETWEFSQDLTGNINSPQDSEVSVSPGMRSALLHLMVGASAQDTPLYYALGPYSYFSESAYEMEDWKERYWGRKNYRRLEKIKREFDEDNVFWCRHCVGDQMDLNTTH